MTPEPGQLRCYIDSNNTYFLLTAIHVWGTCHYKCQMLEHFYYDHFCLSRGIFDHKNTAVIAP